MGPGAPKAMLQVQCTPLPAALDWGEVLLDVQLAPVNPAVRDRGFDNLHHHLRRKAVEFVKCSQQVPQDDAYYNHT